MDITVLKINFSLIDSQNIRLSIQFSESYFSFLVFKYSYQIKCYVDIS